MNNIFIVTLAFSFIFTFVQCDQILTQSEEFEENTNRYVIEGRVYPPELYTADSYWQQNTSISINSGEYKGFLKDDGTFVISGVPSGSYVLEIHNPDYFYEPVRVEINPKGKFRARRVNYIQPSQVIHIPYPLKLKALTRFRYFQQREQWKITDFLFSPMVLMMILPLFLMLILPKMMSDPETKKEMENINFPKMTNDMPEISEVLTSYFTGGSKQEKDKKSSVSAKQSKKRN